MKVVSALEGLSVPAHCPVAVAAASAGVPQVVSSSVNATQQLICRLIIRHHVTVLGSACQGPGSSRLTTKFM